MISNQILQNTIEGLKGISRVDFCVLDTEGKELAATFDMAKDCGEAVLSFVESPADSQVIQGCQFFKIFDEQRLEYVLLADGETEDVYKRQIFCHIKCCCKFLAFCVEYTEINP